MQKPAFSYVPGNDFSVIQLSVTGHIVVGGLPVITYAPRGRGVGQVSHTFPLRITCKNKKKGGGEGSR